MKTLLRYALLLLTIASPFATELLAQPLGGPPPCWPPPCIPIDGGLSALLAMGALYGGKKALELRRAGKRDL
ncbi:MAG: hypothetical protein MUE88_10155 [Flavobacteriales bacterium]|jgi:hypothetical protein|nr:hypothetical protein [Flavobacteriales bacterium]